MINDCEVRFFPILGNELFLARLISLIEVVPEKAIPLNKDNYAVVMKIFNPRKRGMFQFQAFSQNVGEMDISTYLGTWNIDVQ